MPTINQFRALIPGGDKMSDYDIVQEVSKTLGWDEKEVAAKLRFGASNSGITGQQASASVDRYQAGLYGVAEEVAGAVGAKDTSSWLAKQRSENELRADISAQKARKLGAIDTFADVQGVGDFGSYAKGLAIQSAPYLAEALVGGIGGRLAMGGTRLALEEATTAYRAAQASGDVVAAAKAKKAAEVAQKSLSLGSDAGVVAASYPSSVGDVLSNQREQSGTTDAASAFALGVPYAALNVVGLEGALGRGQLFRNPLNLLDNVSGAKGALARTAATGTTAAVKEGAQETSQEFVNQAGRMAVDPTEQFFNEKSNERFKESFIGGATLGGLIGGGAGGWRRSESFVPGANTAANPQTGQTATNEVEQAFQQNPTITPVGTTPGFDMAAQMSGTAGRVDPLTGRSSLVGTQAGTTPEFDMAAQMSGTADRVNPLAGRSSLVDQTAAPITAPAVTGGTTDIAQSQAATQQQNQQQTQADFATQQQQKETERVSYMADRVGLPKPEGQRWDFFGKPVFGPAIQEAAKATADLVGSLKGFQNQITRAINVANEQTGGKLVNVNFNPLKATDSVRKTFEKVAEVAAKFQIAHVGSVEEAAQILEQLSQSTKGAQLEQLNAIHQALTGKDTSGYTASQQTKGAKNGQTLQTTSGLGTVPIQSGTGEGSGANTGDVQPSGVQSLLTGSEPQGQTGQQTGQPSGEGIRTGTGVATDLSGSQQPGQVNEQATSGLGEGQVPNQPQQTATGAVGEQAVQNGPRVYSPTIGYYASDLSHISSERRIEIIRELFGKILASVKGANAETRTEILRLSLLEQFKEKDIADLVGMSEAAVQKQLERMGVKMDRKIGQYVVTDPAIALQMVTEAANFRSAEFPDGIGEGELAGLYATRSEYETNKSQTLAEELEAGEQEGDRSKLLAEEMNRGEGGEDRTMGTIAKAGGSQGAVDSEGKVILNRIDKLQAKVNANPADAKAAADLAKAWNTYSALQKERAAKGEKSVAYEEEEEVDLTGETTKVEAEAKPEVDVAEQTKRDKLVAETRTKRKADRKGLEVGNTVVNPKLGTGVIESFSGDGAETTVTVKFQNGLTKTLSVASAKLEKTNAVQVESADEGNVRKPARSGKTVGEGNAKPEKPAKQTKQAKTEVVPEEVKTPEEQWNELRTLAPELPAYADLNKDQRIRFDDLANRGKANLAAVVNQIVTAPATEIATEKRQTISDVVAEEQTEPVVEEQTEPVAEEELTAEEIIEESPEAAEINPEQQTILEEPIAALPEAQIARLENHYGETRGTSEFFTKLQEDVTAYATKGAQAVAAAIRDIIKAIHAGVLATAMVFNPSLMTKNSEVVVIAPRTVSQVREVKAEVPAVAKANMSKAAQEAYSTIYPSIAAKLKAENKFFVLTDKPNARVFIFNPDGSLFLQKKVLIGKTVGDYYKGNTDKVQNRITPAGLFTMGLRDAKRGGGEAHTAGGYDFGKVFVLDKAIDGEYSVTLFHSVWTKEKDAQQRLAALQKEGAADSRYSFGCINVDKATYGSLVANNLQQMDGAALFIVPDKQELVGEFLTGATAQNKANKDELTRTPFTPKTETVTTTTPAQKGGQATTSKVSVVGREEDVKFGKNIDNETHNEEPYLKENGRTLDLIVNGKVTKTFELVSQGLWDAFKGRPEGQENLLRNKEPKEVRQQAQQELTKARLLHTEYAPLTRNEKLALQAVADKDMDTLRLYERSTSLRQSIFQIVIQATIDPEGSFPSYVLTDAVANRNGNTKQASNLLKYAPSSMMKGVTMPVGLESAQFGKSTAPAKPYTAKSLIAELKAFMRVDTLGRNVIIVDDVAELEDMRDQAIGWSNDKAFGWTRSGKAILVASRIQEGQGRAKFMHEVGGHLGLDRMLAEKDIVSLAGQISKWADLNDNSKESTLARKAVERVGNANVADEDVMSELIAYFVEEAMLAGVDPNAAAKMTGAFGSWFRTLWAGFKNAVRKLGFKPESLTAQDVVNMAYGAARLEIAGTWHGSNVLFRQFSTTKIGTGVGGQLWGQGSYFAQAKPTAEGYAAIDGDSPVGAKAVLYRTSLGVASDEWLKAKQPMNAQSDVVRKGLESLGLYDQNGNISIKWFKEQEKAYGPKKFAAMLDKAGIKGVQYADAVANDGSFNYVVFNDKNIVTLQTNVSASKEKVKFGINPAATVDETINRLPPFVRTPTRSLVTNLLHQAKNGIYASAITEDVVKMASKYMKSANDYLNAQYARQATRIQFEQRINKILSDFDKLSGEYKGTGANSVNKFIKDSTVSGKWGYYPGEHRVGTDLFTVDPDMKLRFDAFDESAQKVIKAVFEHGYEALMLKKKAVEAAIDREFADREKAVMGDAEQMKELAAEKKLLLAREAKVRGVDVSSPYAYLGRYGDHVVVAKSAEFKHYEERAKLGDWDVEQAKQWLQDNVSNSDHYVVQFAETQAEADNIAEKLHATGKYDIMPEDAGVKEAEESYTGGGDIHLAVGRLRNLLQRQVSDGDMSSVNFHSMNKMVGDLYLMTVAEASARKSEMQRKNVSGADDNMMRNLATSGRADAHFLSSLEHNDAITDSMERMRNEARNHRREAMPIYNELIKRQANSMEYKSPGPLSVALTRMNTLWSLTFSPAFYLQQITQTAVISVPYLAGRIGYGNAVSQVNRGYKEIAGLIKGLGINEHIDFSKAPADVRDMLNKLVGMGKIDISMDSAERATADEKGVFAKVMYKMQGVNNRIESVNRSVAAIAAYRGYLEKYGNNNTEAATQYAAQVVSDTHGSYDGFNTPRALSNGIGRVVGQFRRFQIIQLSMLARLMHNSFKGASTEEKMVARKALGFIVAQMSVLGGAMAVPFMSQIAWMMSKILGDPDEPDDFEFKLRRMINNKVVSDLLLRGVPAALGVDVSDKLGMGRVASILPFAQGDLTSRSGAEKIIVAAMGPSASMGMKFADAFGMLLHGDYYKGLEMAMPNGVANVMKAGRFATEGITMRNGDLVLKPEDFGMVDAAFQAVGLPTNTVTDRQFTQNVKAEYDKFYHQKSTDIKGEYVNAYRAGDAQGMAKAREEFQRMEESRVSNGYKRLPMSELLKAPMAAMKRERGVIGGVETTKQNKGFVQLASQI